MDGIPICLVAKGYLFIVVTTSLICSILNINSPYREVIPCFGDEDFSCSSANLQIIFFPSQLLGSMTITENPFSFEVQITLSASI